MPVRNTLRIDVEENYYHVYNRGLNLQPTYHDDADKTYFLEILARYLDPHDEKAFGPELNALKKNNPKPARRELVREMEETAHRLEYAQAAVKMLRGLLAAEKAAQ